VLRRERKKREMTRPFQGDRQHALMAGARPCLAPGLYLAPIGDVAAQPPRLFEVDRLCLVDAKCADPSPSESAAAAPASWPLWASSWCPALSPGLDWLFYRFAHVLFSKIKLSSRLLSLLGKFDYCSKGTSSGSISPPE